MSLKLDIGLVTDEISRNVTEAIRIATEWGIGLFELREGSERRTPYLTSEEISVVEATLCQGGAITALSPGIFKQPVENEEAIRRDLETTLPETIELAQRFNCDTIIVFGFEMMGSGREPRLAVQKVFERAAERAAAAGITLAIENEPEFWVDKPEDSAFLLEEIGHPNLMLNWDPANLHWGGSLPTVEHLEILAPLVRNLHVKDFVADDPRVPWRAVGKGVTPWEELLTAFVVLRQRGKHDVNHITLETHCEPLIENSFTSLAYVRNLLEGIDEKTAIDPANNSGGAS